jgi:hypothetical protein
VTRVNSANKKTTLRSGLLESYSFLTKATVLNVSFWPE